MVEDIEDPRREEPSFVLGEREMLEAWLDFHRITLLLKCEHLDDAGRKLRPIPTSKLSLHGLVRHMAEVERNWFHRVLLRRTARRLPSGTTLPSPTASSFPSTRPTGRPTSPPGKRSVRPAVRQRPGTIWTTSAYGMTSPAR